MATPETPSATGAANPPQLRLLLRLGPYFRPYRGAFALLTLGLVLESLYEVGVRYSFKLIIDQAVLPGDATALTWLLLMLAGGGLVYALAGVGADYLWARYGLLMINDLRHDLFVRLQARSMAFFHRSRGGDLASRFTADVSRVEDGVVYAVPMAASGLLQIAVSLALMARMNSTLFLIGLAGLIISVASPRLINARALVAGYEFRSREGQLAATVQENVAAQTLIKAYGLEQKAAADFRGELNVLTRMGQRSYFLSALTQRTPTLFFILIHLLIFGTGAHLVMQGALSIGELTAFHALFQGLGSSIYNLSWLLPSLFDAVASLQRIVEVMDQPAAGGDVPDARTMAPLQSGVAFENVCFHYPSSEPNAADAEGPATAGLHDLSFALRRGEYAVVVGPTGAGKTTVANLLLRFFEPAAGAIRIDGVDIRQLRLESLRSHIGLVQQEALLFRASLMDNIRAGRLEATDEEVMDAARAAGIHDTILRLPQGYDTVFGLDGRRFSGGECQRIALARALVRRPDILILDEATSSLDLHTEAAILATLATLRGQCTILAITHRLAMAVDADRILVLQDGRLVESGHHAELSGRGGIYAGLWHRGAAAYGGESQS